jgi:uncharacterized Tic20 family protein
MTTPYPDRPEPTEHTEHPQGQNPPPPPGGELPPAAAQPPYQQPGPGQGHPAPVAGYGPGVLDPAQQRQWGMLSHLIPLIAMVLSAGTLGFVGSLVIYVMYKERGDFVRQHAANSLNIQIITGIFLLVSFPLMLVLVGFVTYFVALAFAFVLHVIGALRANEGQLWSPPFTPRFVS